MGACVKYNETPNQDSDAYTSKETNIKRITEDREHIFNGSARIQSSLQKTMTATEAKLDALINMTEEHIINQKSQKGNETFNEENWKLKHDLKDMKKEQANRRGVSEKKHCDNGIGQ